MLTVDAKRRSRRVNCLQQRMGTIFRAVATRMTCFISTTGGWLTSDEDLINDESPRMNINVGKMRYLAEDEREYARKHMSTLLMLEQLQVV